MRGRYVALSFGCTKEASLYYDHVIPIYVAFERLWKSGRKPPPPGYYRELLPDHLRDNERFVERLIAVNTDSDQFFLRIMLERVRRGRRTGGGISNEEISDEQIAAFEGALDHTFSLEAADQRALDFMAEFRTADVACLLPDDAFVSETDECDADVAVTLSIARLIDVSRASWEQIGEFPRDPDARTRLRRLRIFVKDAYAGKSRAYIEDDLLKRIDDYEEEARRWGFETKHCALSMLLTSKSLAGAASGSLISTLFGAPAVAVTSALAGTAIEVGRIGLEVSRRRFVLRNALRDNPISYITELKTKLEDDTQRTDHDA